jgi:hypothetical protein
MKIRPVAADITKLIVAIRNFANAPKKRDNFAVWNSLSEALTVSASHSMHMEVFKTTKALCVCCTKTLALN